MKKELGLQIAIFAALSAAFYFLWGPLLILIFAIIWIDKSLFPHLKFSGQIGLELTTIAVILAGVIYGPLFGFLFAFLFIALVGGILNVIAWRVTRPPEVEWPPLIPSPDHFIDGMIAVLSGLLIGWLPFIYTAVVCILAKTALVSVKENFMLGYVNFIARSINVAINLGIVLYAYIYLVPMLSL